MRSRTLLLLVCLAASVSRLGGETVAIITHKVAGTQPELSREVAAGLYGALARIDQLSVMSPDHTDSMLLTAGVNYEMASPTELGRLLSVSKIVMLAVGGRKQRTVLTAKLYDVGMKRIEAEYTDSCAADPLELSYAARMLAWMLAPDLTASVSVEQSASARDSLRLELQRSRPARRGVEAVLTEQARQRKAAMRRATRKYDLAAGASLIAGVGFTVAGVYYNSSALKKYDETRSAYDAYLTLRSGFADQWAAIERAKDEAGKDINRRNRCYYAAGGAGAVFICAVAAKLFTLRNYKLVASMKHPGIGICYAF